MARHKHIYNSARWQRIRFCKLQQNPLCEYCQPGRQRPATEVDHFVSIENGGDAFNWDNLRSSCKKCHSQKTARGEQLHGCDINGFPRDPQHEWNRV